MVASPARFPTACNREGAAVLDISRNQILVLNSTGAYIWNLLQQGVREEEIVARLASETSTDPKSIGDDVCKFINHLKAERLVQG